MRFICVVALVGMTFSCGKNSKSGDDSNRSPGPNGNNGPVGNLNAPEVLGPWKYVESGTTARLNATAFPLSTPFTGVFAVGDEGVFLESKDSGQTWQKRSIGTDKNLNSIRQVNDIIYVAGDKVFLLSTDDGQNFVEVPGIDFTVRSIAMTTSGDGAFFAVGDGGRVARASLNSTDLNKIEATDLKWEAISVAGAPDLTGVSVSFRDVVVVGKGGFVAASKDIGRSFAKDEGGKTKLDYLAIDDEFMAGNGVFARRYTPSGWQAGSISWKRVESSDLPLIRGLYCFSECTAVGENSEGALVLRISEKGEILDTEAKALHTRFHSIGNLPTNGFIAVGDDGKIMVRGKRE